MRVRQVVFNRSPSGPSRVISILVGAVLLILLAVAFTAFLAVAVVLGIIGGIRLWWARRAAAAAPRPTGVEAEYSVVRRRGTRVT